MEHPYGKQYGQEGNPRAYMTMRDYRNLPYQWGNQQPVGRNPNPNMSLREYRDKYMSAPVYHVPSTYPPPLQNDHPEPHPREDEGQRHSSYQEESIHTISEKTLMIEKLNILTRRLDVMEMKNQHNIHSVNEFSASQPSCYNYQSHGHYGENCQENVQILNQGRPPMSVPFGNSYIQNWKNHSNLPGNPKLSPTDQQQFAPTSQQQQPSPLSLVEQAILNLSKQVDNFIKEKRVVTVQANQETETVESSLNKELDGLQSEIDQKLDIQQESILKLVPQFVHQEEKNLEEESQEEECLTGTILGEQVQLQPQEELKMESVETPEELKDAPVTFWPWTNEEQISALISEEESQEEECLDGTIVEEQCEQQPHQELIEDSIELSEGLTESSDMCDVVFPRENQEEIISLLTEEAVEEYKENISPLPPTDSVYILPLLAPQSQPKTPLPVAPSDNQVYILPTPAENPKPATPAPKARSNPSLHAMKNLKILVASVHTFATTSKKMANAYIAWHSGWFGCGFGFGTPGPRHF